MRLVYLATPYSHPDPIVRADRFEAVNRVAALLIQEGNHVFSPISQTHPIALAGELPLEWGYWEAYDRRMLSVCDALAVLMLTGWIESRGVSAEIAIAKEFGLPIEYLLEPTT